MFSSSSSLNEVSLFFFFFFSLCRQAHGWAAVGGCVTVFFFFFNSLFKEHDLFGFFFKYIFITCIFIWLHQVFIMALEIFSCHMQNPACSMWDLVP